MQLCRLRSLLGAILVTLIVALAQVPTGTITGLVKDESGAVVRWNWRLSHRLRISRLVAATAGEDLHANLQTHANRASSKSERKRTAS